MRVRTHPVALTIFSLLVLPLLAASLNCRPESTAVHHLALSLDQSTRLLLGSIFDPRGQSIWTMVVVLMAIPLLGWLLRQSK